MKRKKRYQPLYARVVARTNIEPQKAFSLNVVLALIALLALITHAMLINHLNTANFRLSDLAREESRLAQQNNELKGRISELQTLGTVEERAIELGMVAVSEYTFLSSSQTVFAQR